MTEINAMSQTLANDYAAHHLVRSAGRFLPMNWSPFRTRQEPVLGSHQHTDFKHLKEVPR